MPGAGPDERTEKPERVAIRIDSYAKVGTKSAKSGDGARVPWVWWTWNPRNPSTVPTFRSHFSSPLFSVPFRVTNVLTCPPPQHKNQGLANHVGFTRHISKQFELQYQPPSCSGCHYTPGADDDTHRPTRSQTLRSQLLKRAGPCSITSRQGSTAPRKKGHQ